MQASTAKSPDLNARRSFAFDARRWTPCEVISAALPLVVLGLVARPWHDIHFAECPSNHPLSCQVSVTGSVQGVQAHGYLWFTALPCLIILAILVLRAGYGQVRALVWPTDKQWLAGAAAADLVIVFAAFITKAGYIALPNPRHLPVEPSPDPVLSVTWESTAFLALATAAACAVTAALNLHRSSPSSLDHRL